MCTIQGRFVHSQCHASLTSLQFPKFSSPSRSQQNTLFSGCPHSLLLPPATPLAIIHPLSVSMDLPILGISYKRNQKICALSCLASFTCHNISEVHPNYHQHFTPGDSDVTVYCMATYHCFISSSSDGHFGGFYLVAIVANVAMSVCVQVTMFPFLLGLHGGAESLDCVIIR